MNIYPYCEIVRTGDSCSPYALVITYAEDSWTVERMSSFDDACRRADEWQHFWRAEGAEGSRHGWLLASTAAIPD
jgi:hypothetical protein